MRSGGTIPRVTSMASRAHITDHRHTRAQGDTNTYNSHCIRDVSFSVIVRIEFRAPLLGDPIEGSLLQPHPYGRGPCKVR